MVRIMPYRTMENIIGGVVITFTNITAAKPWKRSCGRKMPA
jgi:two-component system CheB/CheR fusion protein